MFMLLLLISRLWQTFLGFIAILAYLILFFVGSFLLGVFLQKLGVSIMTSTFSGMLFGVFLLVILEKNK